MPEPKPFYKAFHESLEDEPTPELMEFLKGSKEERVFRLEIYRNNIFSSLSQALKDNYPFTTQILGEERNNILLPQFIHNFPPRSGQLYKYGREFPEFLESFSSELNIPFLAALAQIEHLKREALFCEDSTPLAQDKLSKTPPNTYPSLTFTFPASCHFFESSFNLKSILENLKNDRSEGTFERTSSYLVLIRPHMEVIFHWLTKSEFIFFHSLHSGTVLKEAYESAIKVDEQFDPIQVLHRALDSEFFTDFNLPGDSNEHFNE